MNLDSEQIQFDASVTVAQDQPLAPTKIYDALSQWLGHENISKQNILNKKVIVYSNGSQQYVLLTKCVTYLGNPHPQYKKRIQLPKWYQQFCIDIHNNGLDYDVRFIGVYHYDGNIIFVDFAKDSYLLHGLHNSSAHVYINDLFQAMTYGVFRKIDNLGNTIVTIRNDKLKSYLDGKVEIQDNLFELFRKFNSGYPFGQWLYALDIIKKMHAEDWYSWKQTEWAGWFLDFEFDKFTRKNKILSQMRYIGASNKREGELDFDIRFEEADFYGDLKASDIKHNDAPGNDQSSLVECIYRYDKFWYVIYEHETKKDSECGYEATIARNRYIKSINPSYSKGEMSYAQRMKHSVRFVKMTIIELNKANFREALKTFNQGRQPDGKARAPKFNINKKTLSNDNYVVFRYIYG